MQGRIYTVSFKAVAITAVQDLFSFTPADDHPIALVAMEFSNVGGTADAGDAQEELLGITINRGARTVGSVGTAPTPQPLNPNDAAANFTARANDTTQAVAGGGTIVQLGAFGLNIRQPTPWYWPPEMRIGDAQAGANASLLVVSLDVAPNDSVSVSGTAWVEEF